MNLLICIAVWAAVGTVAEARDGVAGERAALKSLEQTVDPLAGDGGIGESIWGALNYLKQKVDPCKALVVAGAATAVVAAPLVLGAVGFTTAGITAGSYAAGMMSTAAVANGGAVAAGSTVAALQAAGAAGLSGAANAAMAATGAAVGYLSNVCGSPN